MNQRLVGYKHIKKYFYLPLLILFLHACAPASDTSPSEPLPDLPPAQSISDKIQKNAEIFFWVEIPTNTPPGEIIKIVFLDEVTGLPLSPKYINLHAVDATHYGIAIHAEVGAVLKYLFVRENLNGNRAREYTLAGEPVRYRTFFVDGPGETHELVARWADTEPERGQGRISGIAVDTETNLPIPNLLVLAGGERVLTNSDGSFLFPALIAGQHQITAYSMDGQHLPFKQNARVQAGAETPTTLSLQPAPLINVTFVVTVPEDTIPSVPVRIAGNLSQLGNTFTDLGGGTSLMVTKMPQLQPLSNGTYGVTLQLYGGTFLRYNYTQGDGFWNVEQNAAGSLPPREIYLPLYEEQLVLQDQVENWQTPGAAPILFDVLVPPNTPTRDEIYIQFNRDGWMSPLPMWPVSENRWAYQLAAPFPAEETLTYRYCRNAICGDEFPLASIETPYQIETNHSSLQIVRDIITQWHMFAPRQFPTTVLANTVQRRDADFLGGVMLSPAYMPIWGAHTINTYLTIQELNANTVILTPSWSATQANLPHLTPVLGHSQSWDTLAESILTTQAIGMKAILFPQIQLPDTPEAWWAEVPDTTAGWQVWWEQYRAFVLHHADIAQRYNVDTLVLGGEWLTPALPGAREHLPSDLDAHWRKLLNDVRLHYGGKIAWYLPATEEQTAPAFLADTVDVIYLHWGISLATWSEASLSVLQSRINLVLAEDVKPLTDTTGLPIVLAVDYPSAQGGVTNCITPLDDEACIPFEALSPIYEENPFVSLDLQEQVEVYNALLAAVNETEWLEGFISVGYFAPVGLEDKSSSIHGKPAEDVLRYWFNQMLEK